LSAEATQLVYVELDSSNKAEAACLIKASSKPTALLFSSERLLRQDVLRFFGGMSGKWDREKQLASCMGV
jgi:hypothetical protein